MKRRLAVLLLVLLLLSGTLAPAAALAQTYDRGLITGDSVAFRRGADQDAALIRRLARGTVVEILETNVNAEWHRVRYAGATGYVNRMYVNLDLSLPAYRREYTATVVNCREFVNVRAAATASSKRVGTAEKGSVWTVTEAFAADGCIGSTSTARRPIFRPTICGLPPKRRMRSLRRSPYRAAR